MQVFSTFPPSIKKKKLAQYIKLIKTFMKIDVQLEEVSHTNIMVAFQIYGRLFSWFVRVPLISVDVSGKNSNIHTFFLAALIYFLQ